MAIAAPLTSFYVTGGTLQQDAPSYVEREADRELHAALQQGEFCYVLTARQMGKSSLMVRTAARLREEGVRVAILDLTAIGQNLIPEQWYGGLLRRLGRQLGLEEEVEEFWLAEEQRGPLERWLAALEQVALPQAAGPLVICIDEIDAVRSLPFSTDEFFAALRECYNRRTTDPVFQRLTFCLLGVAAPSDLIRDTRLTPFNIGRRIELTDFSAAEAAPLAAGLGRKESSAGRLLARVLHWTDGHPYLTQRLCQVVADDPKALLPADVDRHCEALFLSASAREKDDNLLFVRERLLRSEADLASLLDLYAQVRAGKRVGVDDTNPLIDLLRLSGIARLQGGQLRVRNRIYERVFDREWVAQHMPDAELRRQRAAFRRGLLRATAVSGVVLTAMATLSLLAVTQARRADRQRRAADQQRRVANEQRLEARRNLYASRMNLAQRLWEDGNMARAAELLDAWRPKPNQEDLRGWEWRYLWRLFRDGSRLTLPLGGSVWPVAFSPAAYPHHGTRLFASSSGGSTEVRLWDLSSRKKVASLSAHHGVVRSLAFSPDGRVLASGSRTGTIELWDVASRRVIGTLQGHTGSVEKVVFSADGKKIASRGQDSTVRLWAVGARKLLGRFPLKPDYGGNSLALSPDGNILAVDASLLKLWDTRTGREIASLVGHYSGAIGLAFSPDGKLLASGGEDSIVRLWDLAPTRTAGVRDRDIRGVERRRPLALFRGHRGSIYSVTFSPDGKTVASTGEDSTIKLWDVARRQEVTTLKGHKGEVGTVAFWPDSRTVASAGSDGTVKLWDAVAKSDAGVFRGHQLYVNCVALAPDGKTLASEGSDGLVKLWDARTRRVLAVLPKHGDQVFQVAFSPDRRFLATGSSDNTVRLWDLAGFPPKAGLPRNGWRPVHVFPGFLGSGPWRGMMFSADGKTLTMRCRDKRVRQWDVLSHRLVAVVKTQMKAGPTWIALSPDGKTLAAAGWNDPVELIDIASGRVVTTFGSGRDLVFSPDGRTLATAEGDTVKLWDVAARRARATLKGSASARNGTLAFSPDGKMLAAGCSDSTIKVWSLAMNQEVAVLKGHTGYITGIAFSPDGNTVASGGIDATVRLWHAATFQETDPLQVVASASSGNVTLQWQPLSWALGYNVYRTSVLGDGSSGLSPNTQSTRFAGTRTTKTGFGFVKLNTQPVVGDTFADRDPGLADGRSQLYAAAPLYRGAASRVTEGPRVMLRVALAPVPLGWMGTSINEGLRSGSVLFDARTALDGQIVLRGSGEDISGAADGCYFLSQPVEGDFQLTVQALTRPAATHAWAKAGLMLRESLQPGARNASLFTTAESGLTYQWRPAANDLTESKAVLEHAGLKLPILLRITRRGNTISTEYSMDYGKRFHPADDPFPFQPPLPEAIYAGLAITAHDPAQVSEAKFSGLEVRKR